MALLSDKIFSFVLQTRLFKCYLYRMLLRKFWFINPMFAKWRVGNSGFPPGLEKWADFFFIKLFEGVYEWSLSQGYVYDWSGLSDNTLRKFTKARKCLMKSSQKTFPVRENDKFQTNSGEVRENNFQDKSGNCNLSSAFCTSFFRVRAQSGHNWAQLHFNPILPFLSVFSSLWQQNQMI